MPGLRPVINGGAFGAPADPSLAEGHASQKDEDFLGQISEMSEETERLEINRWKYFLGMVGKFINQQLLLEMVLENATQIARDVRNGATMAHQAAHVAEKVANAAEKAADDAQESIPERFNRLRRIATKARRVASEARKLANELEEASDIIT